MRQHSKVQQPRPRAAGRQGRTSAVFELARMAHEREAVGKLTAALRKRLDVLEARLATLDTQGKELWTGAAFWEKSPRKSGAKPVPGAKPPRLATRAPVAPSRQPVGGRTAPRPGPKVMSWKF